MLIETTLHIIMNQSKSWSGNFYIGNSFAIYTGLSEANDTHKHAACQLVYCHSGNAEVINELGHKIVGKTILIRPLTLHSIHSNSSLTLLYLEADSDLTSKLLKKMDLEDISIIDNHYLPIDLDVDPKILAHSLTLLADKPSNNLDHRILLAMQKLAKNPGVISIAETAKQCGLSQSRLRTIVREQLGVSLAKWLLWRKLQSAAKSLRDGANITEAAMIGGFSDQAHFTRTMRQMFGITPSVAINALR